MSDSVYRPPTQKAGEPDPDPKIPARVVIINKPAAARADNLIRALRADVSRFYSAAARLSDQGILAVEQQVQVGVGYELRYTNQFGTETVQIKVTDIDKLEKYLAAEKKPIQEARYKTALIELQKDDITFVNTDDNAEDRTTLLMAYIPPRDFSTTPQKRRVSRFRARGGGTTYADNPSVEFAHVGAVLGDTYDPGGLCRASLKIDLTPYTGQTEVEVELYGAFGPYIVENAIVSSVLVGHSAPLHVETITTYYGDVIVVSEEQQVFSWTVEGEEWADANFGTREEAFEWLKTQHTYWYATGMVLDTGQDTADSFFIDVPAFESEPPAPIGAAAATVDAVITAVNSFGTAVAGAMNFPDTSVTATVTHHETDTDINLETGVFADVSLAIDWYAPIRDTSEEQEAGAAELYGATFLADPLQAVTHHVADGSPDNQIEYYIWEDPNIFPSRPERKYLGEASIPPEDTADTTILGEQVRRMGSFRIDLLGGQIRWTPA